MNTSPFIEIAQSLQQALGQAGVEAEIVPQDGSALWPKYRARRHMPNHAYTQQLFQAAQGYRRDFVARVADDL